MFALPRFAPFALLILVACAASEDAVVMEEAMLEPEVASDAAAPHRRATGHVRSGVLTAGDIDDAQNLAAFRRLAKTAAKSLDLPNPGGGQAVALTLVGPDRTPAPGVRVTLRKPGAAQPFYDGYSGVGGRLTVFPALFGTGPLTEVELHAFNTQSRQKTTEFIKVGQSTQVVLPHGSSWSPGFLDLVFVVDTTGSMSDELNWLTRDLNRIVDNARKISPDVNIRYGLVTYRDQGDDYVVRNYGFTDHGRRMRNWLRSESANGGGDYPEAAAQALESAVNLNWRRGKGERLLFHIADAPPHHADAPRYLNAAIKAANNGVQIFGLGASGVGIKAEYLMRQASLVTGGRYLFLTNDSGVGHAHAEPRVSCYRVTSLSGLVRRILMSELSGRRFEATEQNVIRDVGTYRAGRCLS